MTLNSFNFLVSFAIFFLFLVLLELGKRIKGFKCVGSTIQITWLLLFSYYCIGTADWRFCVCVFAVTIISYGVSFGIEHIRKNRDNKSLLKTITYIGVISLLGFLGYFKYSNFFIESFNSLFGGNCSSLNVLLPIGISFYVFSALSYIIDVYHEKYKAERNLLYFALYISFFPKITAGPIVRADAFLPQVKEYKGVEKHAVLEGVQVFAFGLFKKIVLADHLGVFVDDVFLSPMAFNTGTAILGVLSYSLQIYFDFSGYSDMAIGIAKIVGFDFKANFNLPYFAENISDFWKRWHISLSSWLRDYVYIPLGGSRRGETRTYINLLLTMLISGLWHGAGWTFVVWGGMHGLVSCLNRLQRNYGEKNGSIRRITRVALTFIVVSLLWIFFRATSLENAIEMYRAIFTIHAGINQPYTWTFFAVLTLSIATIVAWRTNKGRGFYPVLNLEKFWDLVLFLVFFGITIIMGYFGNSAFIYGKF